MEIKKVGVVGCGVMGSGIAQVCAQSGYDVKVSEVDDRQLAKGLERISSFLTKGIEKGKTTPQEKKATLARIKGTTKIEDLSDCDLVIEAIVEDVDAKKRVFAQLDKICPRETILATNTSRLSVIDIATATTRLDKVLGLHFFNPVPLLKLLEIYKTIATGDDTLNACKKFGESLGKTIVVSQDMCAFSPPVALQLEAIRMLEADAASREDIDARIKLGFNHPMGPLELMDLVGLDVVLHVSEILFKLSNSPVYAPPPLLRKMVIAGWLGKKTRKGFYDY